MFGSPSAGVRRRGWQERRRPWQYEGMQDHEEQENEEPEEIEELVWEGADPFMEEHITMPTGR